MLRNAHIWRYNYVGKAREIVCEGAKKVFELSFDKHKLTHVEYLGNGNIKIYISIKNTFSGYEIKRLERVSHYQIRIVTRLKYLKNKKKSLGRRGQLTDATIERSQNFAGVAIR